MFCVRQSSVRGCRFSFVFVYLIIKVLNVRRFPPPSSRIYELRYNELYRCYLHNNTAKWIDPHQNLFYRDIVSRHKYLNSSASVDMYCFFIFGFGLFYAKVLFPVFFRECSHANVLFCVCFHACTTHFTFNLCLPKETS